MTENLKRSKIFAQCPSFYLKMVINYKGKTSSFIVEKPSRHYLNQLTQVTITSIKKYTIMNPLRIVHYCGIDVKNAYPQSSHERTSDKPKLRGILQNNWPVLFKSMKKQGKMRNFHTREDTKETWQLRATWDPGSDSGTKRHGGKTSEIWKSSVV